MFYGCESVAYFMKEKLKLPALSHYIASLKNVFKKEKKNGVNYGEYKKLRFLN